MRKGQKASEEQLKKMSLCNPKIWLGKKFSDEHRKKISESRKGFKMSEKQKIKMRENKIGNKHWHWYQDRSKLKTQEDRRSTAVNEWRINIYKRDNYKCKISNKNCEGRLEAHHILNWEEFPELRYDINNGITLCHAHHPRGRAKEKQLSPYLQDLVISKY